MRWWNEDPVEMEWLKRYKARMIERGLSQSEAEEDDRASSKDITEAVNVHEPIVAKLNKIKFKNEDTLVIWVPLEYYGHRLQSLKNQLSRFQAALANNIHLLILPNNLRISVLSKDESEASKEESDVRSITLEDE